MFCTNCGNKLRENAKFCSNCGNAVKQSKTETKSEAPGLTIVQNKESVKPQTFSQKIIPPTEPRDFKFKDYIRWKFYDEKAEKENIEFKTLIASWIACTVLFIITDHDNFFRIIVSLVWGVIFGAIIGAGVSKFRCSLFDKKYQNEYSKKTIYYKQKILIPVNLEIKNHIFSKIGFTAEEIERLDTFFGTSFFDKMIDDNCKIWAKRQRVTKNKYTLEDYRKTVYQKIFESIIINYHDKYITNSLKKLNKLKNKHGDKPYFHKFTDRIGIIENNHDSEKMSSKNLTLEDGIKLKNLQNSLSELIQDIKNEEEIYKFKQIVDEFKNIFNPRQRYSEEFITEFDNFVSEVLQDNIDIFQKNALSKTFKLIQEKCEAENDRIGNENEKIYTDVQKLKSKLQILMEDKKFSNDFFECAKNTKNKLNIEFEKLDKSLAEINNIINTASENIEHLESMIPEEEKTSNEISELETLIRQTISKKESAKKNEYSHAFENKFTDMQTILDRLPHIYKQSLSDIQTELEKFRKDVDSIIADMDRELSEMEERFKIKENYRSELERLYNDIEKLFRTDVEIVKNSSRYAETREKINKITGMHYEDAESEYHKLEKEISELKADIHKEILEIIEEKRIARTKQIESLSVNAKLILNLLPSFSGNAKIDLSLLQKVTDEAEQLISDTEEFISLKA